MVGMVILVYWKKIIPRLRQKGVGDQENNRMLINNPRRSFKEIEK